LCVGDNSTAECYVQSALQLLFETPSVFIMGLYTLFAYLCLTRRITRLQLAWLQTPTITFCYLTGLVAFVFNVSFGAVGNSGGWVVGSYRVCTTTALTILTTVCCHGGSHRWCWVKPRVMLLPFMLPCHCSREVADTALMQRPKGIAVPHALRMGHPFPDCRCRLCHCHFAPHPPRMVRIRRSSCLRCCSSTGCEESFIDC